MYHKLGYVVYRNIIDYYSGDADEDAHGKPIILPLQMLKNSQLSRLLLYS